jgi:hypothetical protein
MKTHILKLNEQFCEQVNCGIKTFEIRNNDRNFHVGDQIRFHAVHNGKEYPNRINVSKYLITYVLSGWGLQPGYVALGIKKMKLEEEDDGNETGSDNNRGPSAVQITEV